jgi:hypothetical protein
MISLPLGVALQLALSVAAALLTSGTRLRRSVGLLLAACLLGVPWFADTPVVRGALCLAAIAGFGRVFDLERDGRSRTVAQRLGHVLSPIDSTQLKRVPPKLDVAAFGAVLLWLFAAALGGLVVAETTLPHDSAAFWIARWAGGLVLVYALADAIHAFLALVYRLVGFAYPRQHRLPAASLNLRDFWGRRWNRTVSEWLRQRVFRYWGRRGHTKTGIVLSFLVSAIIHFYFAWVAIGIEMAFVMGSYFLVQGLFVLAETPLRVKSWKAWEGRLWFIATMTISSPLFVEPFLRVLGL